MKKKVVVMILALTMAAGGVVGYAGAQHADAIVAKAAGTDQESSDKKTSEEKSETSSDKKNSEQKDETSAAAEPEKQTAEDEETAKSKSSEDKKSSEKASGKKTSDKAEAADKESSADSENTVEDSAAAADTQDAADGRSAADAESSDAETSDEKASGAKESNEVTIAADETILTVTGTGTSTVTPDKASITIGVQTTDESSKTVQDQNSKSVNNVIDALLEEGIEKKNITTSSFDLYANYDYSEDGNELTGYTATTMLTIKDLSIDDVGELVDKAADAGVNMMNGISYYYSKNEDAYDEALEAALDRAAEKAQKIAAQKDCKVGRLISITEGTESASTGDAKSTAASQEETADAAMEVLPGENSVTATVTVTYELEISDSATDSQKASSEEKVTKEAVTSETSSSENEKENEESAAAEEQKETEKGEPSKKETQKEKTDGNDIGKKTTQKSTQKATAQ